MKGPIPTSRDGGSKDVADGVRVAENAGLSHNVARLGPPGVIKGLLTQAFEGGES